MARLTRYERNMSRGGINESAQEKLMNSKVLVMGAGGLGSSVIMNLSALGIGQIKIVDCGIVEESGLNRQIIHKERNIKRASVMSAKDWISEFNSDIKVEVEKIQINSSNYYDVIDSYDIIVDCFDKLEDKFILNKIAVENRKILVHGLVSGFSGQVTTIASPKTGCLCCFAKKPKVFLNEQMAQLSPIVNIIGSLQANEVLKIITGYGEILLNKLLTYDATNNSFKIISYSKDISCEQCGEVAFL